MATIFSKHEIFLWEKLTLMHNKQFKHLSTYITYITFKHFKSITSVQPISHTRPRNPHDCGNSQPSLPPHFLHTHKTSNAHDVILEPTNY